MQKTFANKPIVLVDADEVLYPHSDVMKEFLSEFPWITWLDRVHCREWEYHLNYDQRYKHLVQGLCYNPPPGFYNQKIHPMKDAVLGMKKLAQFANIIICTIPTKKEGFDEKFLRKNETYESVRMRICLEKGEYLCNWFGEWYTRIIFTENKKIIPAVAIIDDKPDLFGENEKVACGTHILFDKHYTYNNRSKKLLADWSTIPELAKRLLAGEVIEKNYLHY